MVKRNDSRIKHWGNDITPSVKNEFDQIKEALDDLESPLSELDLAKQLKEVLSALGKSKELTRIWHSYHDLTLSPKEVEESWEIYQLSPEMLVINKAITNTLETLIDLAKSTTG